MSNEVKNAVMAALAEMGMTPKASDSSTPATPPPPAVDPVAIAKAAAAEALAAARSQSEAEDSLAAKIAAAIQGKPTPRSTPGSTPQGPPKEDQWGLALDTDMGTVERWKEEGTLKQHAEKFRNSLPGGSWTGFQGRKNKHK